MNIYETESGYEVTETLSGLEVYDCGKHVCDIDCKTFNDYLDEDDIIDDERLEADIKEAIDVQDFLDYQSEYC